MCIFVVVCDIVYINKNFKCNICLFLEIEVKCLFGGNLNFCGFSLKETWPLKKMYISYLGFF